MTAKRYLYHGKVYTQADIDEIEAEAARQVKALKQWLQKQNPHQHKG